MTPFGVSSGENASRIKSYREVATSLSTCPWRMIISMPPSRFSRIKSKDLCDRRDPALNEVRLFLNDFRRGEHGAKRYVRENITDIDQPFESLFEELAIHWRSQESSRSSALHQGGGLSLVTRDVEVLRKIRRNLRFTE